MTSSEFLRRTPFCCPNRRELVNLQCFTSRDVLRQCRCTVVVAEGCADQVAITHLRVAKIILRQTCHWQRHTVLWIYERQFWPFTFIQFWYANWLLAPPIVTWKQYRRLGPPRFKKEGRLSPRLQLFLRKNLPDINCIKHHLPIGSLDVQGPDIMGRTIFRVFGCFWTQALTCVLHHIYNLHMKKT